MVAAFIMHKIRGTANASGVMLRRSSYGNVLRF